MSISFRLPTNQLSSQTVAKANGLTPLVCPHFPKRVINTLDFFFSVFSPTAIFPLRITFVQDQRRMDLPSDTPKPSSDGVMVLVLPGAVTVMEPTKTRMYSVVCRCQCDGTRTVAPRRGISLCKSRRRKYGGRRRRVSVDEFVTDGRLDS